MRFTPRRTWGEAFVPILLASLIMGCAARPAAGPGSSQPLQPPQPAQSAPAAPRTPKEFGAVETKSIRPMVTDPVWSVDPSEFMLDGIRLGDPFDAASKRYGAPVQNRPIPLGAGGSIKQMLEYRFANGIKVTSADGRIDRIEADRTISGWETARGIRPGTPCEVVRERFGLSHDGGDTYIYFAQGSQGPLTMALLCSAGKIAALDLTGL